MTLYMSKNVYWNCNPPNNNVKFASWENSNNWYPVIIPTINDTVFIGKSLCVPYIQNNITISNLYLNNIEGIYISNSTLKVLDIMNNGTISMNKGTLIFENTFKLDIYGAIIMTGNICGNSLEISSDNSFIQIVGESKLYLYLINNYGLLYISESSLIYISSYIQNTKGNIYIKLPNTKIYSNSFIIDGTIIIDIQIYFNDTYKEKILICDNNCKYFKISKNIKISIIQPNINAHLIIDKFFATIVLTK